MTEPQPPAAAPESNGDFVTTACDMGAHERCRLGDREQRACQCGCHKERPKETQKRPNTR